MINFAKKITSLFFPQFFIRATKHDIDQLKLSQQKTLKLLEEYDKGQIDINYSVELKKLEKFARSSR